MAILSIMCILLTISVHSSIVGVSESSKCPVMVFLPAYIKTLNKYSLKCPGGKPAFLKMKVLNRKDIFMLQMPSSLYYSKLLRLVQSQQKGLFCENGNLPPLLALKKWLNDIVSCLHLEDIRYTLSNSLIKFSKIWGLFIEHIKRMRSQAD